jgi:hypothetical protein
MYAASAELRCVTLTYVPFMLSSRQQKKQQKKQLKIKLILKKCLEHKLLRLMVQ